MTTKLQSTQTESGMTSTDKTKLDLLTLADAVGITGGGSILLGGYTLTIPGTGTAMLVGASDINSIQRSWFLA